MQNSHSARCTLAAVLLVAQSLAFATPLAPYAQAVQDLAQAIRAQGDAILVYQFDARHPIPIRSQEADGARGATLGQDARVVVIPKASSYFNPPTHPGTMTGMKPVLRPRLLLDTGSGPVDGRCENNDSAVVEQWQQTMETRTPVEAWEKLGQPDIAFNANFFEIRAQKNGVSWTSTQCSLPLGYYFSMGLPGGDSNHGTVMAAGGKYLVGPNMFVDKAGNTALLNTFIIAQKPGQRTVFEVSDQPGAKQASPLDPQTLIDGHIRNREPFLAVSGGALIRNGQDVTLTQVSGSTYKDRGTTRIAIGYDGDTDRLFIFEGGAYRDGLTRRNLQAIMLELGAKEAVELDGGGSAAIVVRNGAAKWAGASTTAPTGSCPGSGAYCTPITQPDGTPRPVPGWVGLDFRPNETPQ